MYVCVCVCVCVCVRVRACVRACVCLYRVCQSTYKIHICKDLTKSMYRYYFYANESYNEIFVYICVVSGFRSFMYTNLTINGIHFHLTAALFV